MSLQHPITYDELLDNYEFKVVRRLLKKEYPWIKDVIIKNPDEINKWNLIFLDAIIDPFELGRQKGWTVSPYITRRIIQDGEYWSPYLSIIYDDVTWEEAKPFQDEINKTVESIHSSPAMPQDMKLPGTRKFQIGNWLAYPTTITPEDTTQSSD
jgi:hypothetical protein